MCNLRSVHFKLNRAATHPSIAVFHYQHNLMASFGQFCLLHLQPLLSQLGHFEQFLGDVELKRTVKCLE
jgi:hypothetical protein